MHKGYACCGAALLLGFVFGSSNAFSSCWVVQILSQVTLPDLHDNQAGFTEYYQTWLRHWRLDNSIIQRGVTSDNWSRPLAFFLKVVCRVSSRQGATIDVFKSEIENQK